jgi:HEAT repeat protein
MAVTYFCPACWREIPPGISLCPVCRADLIAEDAKPFVEKLCRALNHPEPQTAVRAAWVLGERRERVAVDDLIRTSEMTSDIFLAESAAEALEKIGDAKASDSLRHAEEAGAVRVRRAARRAILQLRPKSVEESSKDEQATDNPMQGHRPQ